MKIETYEEAAFTDSASGLAIEGEMLNLIEELGLEGQKNISTGNETGNICPYRKMTAIEQKAFKLAFPHETKMENYREGVIPLRVLQVAKHAKEWLPRITVWHPEPGNPDPLLVGYEKADWGGTPFILARWGDALMTFEEICQKAKRALVSKLRKEHIEAESKLRDAKALLDNCDGVELDHLPSQISCYTH